MGLIKIQFPNLLCLPCEVIWGYNLEVMKRLIVLIALLVVAVGLFMPGDSKASVADTNVPNNDVTTTVNQTDNPSSATAAITITMRTLPLPGE